MQLAAATQGDSFHPWNASFFKYIDLKALYNKNNYQTAPMVPQPIDPGRQFWTLRHRELI